LNHARGLAVDFLSRHYMGRATSRGLLLGFTGSPAADLRRGVQTLARLL
jgi:DNA-binding transcriptional MocR family regulator